MGEIRVVDAPARQRRARRSSNPTFERRIDRLRRQYFASAWEMASRYRIDFDRVLEHLWQVRRAQRRFTIRQVACWEDLMQAIACVDGSAAAWADLVEGHERQLVRLCRGGRGDVEATVVVRRLFADLRRRSAHSARQLTDSTPSLRDYAGQRPLRQWLLERLNAQRALRGPTSKDAAGR